MKLARVAGPVVSTIKHSFFEGRTLLLCDYVSPEGQEMGAYTIAVDTVGAGSGELVLILDEGSSARQIIGQKNAPVRAVVVGIIDEVALW
ncbi:MAG: EutN/CcmL family microcompartment protein [Ardenticatenaceae bacterium]